MLEPGRLDEVEPELRSARERVADLLCGLALRRCRRGRTPEHPGVLAEEERDAIESRADPHELARRTELVELEGRVRRDAPREHLALPERDGQREALERDQRLAQGRAPVDSVPARQEAAERRLLGGLHLLAESSEGRATQPPQHVGVAPLALGASGTELAADELVLALELAELLLDVASEVFVGLSGRERPAALREPVHELLQRSRGLRRLQERVGQAARRHHP
jgi:hypothetical protein